MENYNYEPQGQSSFIPPMRNLPNSTAVLVLGILSIVFTCCKGLGVIMAIIALAISVKDTRMYKEAPELYIPGSYSNLKAGKICALIGICIGIIMVILIIIGVSINGMDDIKKYQGNY